LKFDSVEKIINGGIENKVEAKLKKDGGGKK
jgi:hypothetical protein